MRRAILMCLLACSLAGGCTGSVAGHTVTVVQTLTTTALTPAGPTASTAQSTTSPAASHTARSSTPEPTTPRPARTVSATPQILTVDPLTADCPTVLDATDVHQMLAVTIPSGYHRTRDVPNSVRGVTGKIRCYYPKADPAGHGPVVIALTQYRSAAYAATQIAATVDSEINAGAAASTPTVSGYPAHLLLRSGGLIVVQYGTWTLAIATAAALAGKAALTSGLPGLAARVLTRIINNN